MESKHHISLSEDEMTDNTFPQKTCSRQIRVSVKLLPTTLITLTDIFKKYS